MQIAFHCFVREKTNKQITQAVYLLIAFLICQNQKMKAPGHVGLLGKHAEMMATQCYALK